MQKTKMVAVKTVVTHEKTRSGAFEDTKHFDAVEYVSAEKILHKGDQVGPYEIDQLIGSGGMSKVYLARQLSLNRKVALKIVEGIAENEDILESFQKEMKTTAKISHRNIVTAFEGGVSGRNFYLSMNYIDGRNLEEIVEQEGPLPEAKALEIVLTVAETLSYLWETILIFHKDIKPSNIMIDRYDELFILDLGISQYFGDTSQKEPVGSPSYMSPEQIQGQVLDWRSDLYSLGATLYFLIFGRAPFEDEDINTIIRGHLKGVFPVPKDRKVLEKASPNCLALMRKMMARNRVERHQNWVSFISEVKRIQNAPREKELGHSLEYDAEPRIKAGQDVISIRRPPVSQLQVKSAATPPKDKPISIPPKTAKGGLEIKKTPVQAPAKDAKAGKLSIPVKKPKPLTVVSKDPDSIRHRI